MSLEKSPFLPVGRFLPPLTLFGRLRLYIPIPGFLVPPMVLPIPGLKKLDMLR
jgi:hypothetical protein